MQSPTDALQNAESYTLGDGVHRVVDSEFSQLADEHLVNLYPPLVVRMQALQDTSDTIY